MPTHLWSVLCSKSVIDKDSQQVSLFDVIETIAVKLAEPPPHPPQTGVVPFHTELVTLWRRSDPDLAETATCRCEIVTPAGKSIASSTMQMDFSKTRFRTTFKADALPIEGSGTYLFNVAVQTSADKWQTVASLPLEVTVTLAENEEKKKGKTEGHARPKKKTTAKQRR